MRRMVLGTLFAFTLTTVTAIAANLKVEGKLISTLPFGAPLEVASNEKVENLNADLLDGITSTELVTQTQLAAADFVTSGALGSRDLYRQLVFTEAGELEFVVPAGVTVLDVELVGGGGGGGTSPGGGGGSGLVHREPVFVDPGTTLTIVVGEGGAGAPQWDVLGGQGGPSSVYSTATGALLVSVRGGGSGGNSVGDSVGDGGDGYYGGGGGAAATVIGAGGAGVIAQGFNGSSSGPFLNQGGDGAYGGAGSSDSQGIFGAGGGGGRGGGAGGDEVSGSGAGYPGTRPGAGGGGGLSAAGGDGADGAVVIRWFGPAAT